MKGNVTAFFTDKNLGVNRREIARILGIEESSLYLPIQRHTDRVIVLESSREPLIADAVITRETGVLIGVQVADCVPILVYDREREIIGAVHAGWRGTSEGILKNVLRTMIDKFKSGAKNIVIAVGPSIKWCCYEVGYDVALAVGRATGEGDYLLVRGEKYYLDLPAANKYQAVSMGVPENAIWVCSDCTFCNPEKYFSYRYAKGSTGRQCGFIGKISY